ncbi:DUF4279 domain-containing protein [Streptomyces sp. NPDC060064]|uniref:DUF4279 domain-containing protein n=1 Tax=Streptomyces sp. NPDC060064 TaxID=3347049 RepID=UPI0036AAFDBC
MTLRQYTYFAMFSYHVSAAEMTSQLDITPDEVSVRGSRHTDPPVPVNHVWQIACRDPGLRVDEQIAQILNRLQPHTDRISEVVSRLANHGGGAVLQVVRYFNDINPDQLPSDAPNLFGWHLDRNVLDFLTATGAELDIDEYDMTPGEDAG